MAHDVVWQDALVLMSLLVLALILGSCAIPQSSSPQAPPNAGKEQGMAPSAPGLSSEEGAGGGGQCRQDSDCVPDACCHARGCVPVAEKPACAGVFCTMECASKTMDCGQGRCSCAEHMCRAIQEG